MSRRSRKSGRPAIKSFRTKESARLAFDNGSKKITLSFDEMWDLFAGGSTYEDIAVRGGVSRQAVALLYCKYFASLLAQEIPEMASGTTRRKAIRIKNQPDPLVTVENLRLFNELATAQRLTIKAISTEQTGRHKRYLNNQAYIGDKRCAIYRLNKPYVEGKYYRFNASQSILETCDFLIAITEQKRTFIIPTKIVISTLPAVYRGVKSFFIPTNERPIYKNIQPDVDWLEYEGAWGQLDDEKEKLSL